jgi:hypothetical protein
MNTKSLRSIILVATLLLCSPALLTAADAPGDAAAISAKLFAAIENTDYAAFVADGDAVFQQKLKPEQFAAVAAQLAPMLKAGHAVTYLGELQQKGFRVTLWKLSFRQGGDDLLVTLSLKDGKVGGFWIR